MCKIRAENQATITTSINKHYPRQHLIAAFVNEANTRGTDFYPATPQSDVTTLRTREESQSDKCFGQQEQKWPQPSENIVVGKVKRCGTAVVSAQREERRARCVLEEAAQCAAQSTLTRFVSANP